MTTQPFGHRRPSGWTEDDERAMLAEFTVGGSCGCDGALDNGCPNCTLERAEEWLAERRGRFIDVRTPRYLCYEVDKRQHTPFYMRTLDPIIVSDARAGWTVIVDLVERKRFVNGEWEDVECIDRKDGGA